MIEWREKKRECPFVSKMDSKYQSQFFLKIVSASQSIGRMFEAHHDPCSLFEGEATLPSPTKKYVARNS